MPVTVARGKRKKGSKKEIVYYLEVSVDTDPNLVTGIAEAIDEMRAWGQVEVLDVEVREVPVKAGEGK